MIQVLLLVVAASLAGGVIWSYNDGQRAKARLSVLEKEVQAARGELPHCGAADPLSACAKALGERMATCETEYGKALKLIGTQNDSIRDYERDASRATAEARRLSRLVDAAETQRLSERTRLEALLLAGAKGGECPAGAAVSEVRKGLRK